MTPLPPPIIIYQSSFAGFQACFEQLPKLGLKLNEDFYLIEETDEASDLMIPTVRQMFVTGSIRGNVGEDVALINKLRTLNPQLVTASFSVEKMTGPFDHHAKKGKGDDFCSELAALMKKFLANEI